MKACLENYQDLLRTPEELIPPKKSSGVTVQDMFDPRPLTLRGKITIPR